MKPARLITIIREDLIPGYQIAQTAHAVAEFCVFFHAEAVKWKQEGNYIIALSVKDEKELIELGERLIGHVSTSKFYEPDINQYTALAFVATDYTDYLTEELPLAGKYSGTIDKTFKPAN